MRYPRVSWGLVPAALSLMLAVPLDLQAGGPGKGTFRKQPGGGIASLEARFDLSQFMGEPTVAGVFKWEAEPGYSAKLPSDVVMWLKVRSGTSFAYISCAPVLADAGKGFGMDMTGSPDWKEVLVLEFSGKKAVRTMDASSAKHFWKAGFEVVDVVLSGAPPREGQAAQKGGASGNPSSASDSTKTANVLSTATAPTAAKPMGVATGGPAARTTSSAPSGQSLSRLAPGTLQTPHSGPTGSIPYRTPQPATAAKPAASTPPSRQGSNTQVPGRAVATAPSQTTPSTLVKTPPQQVAAPPAAPSRAPMANPAPGSAPRPQPIAAPTAGDASRSSRPTTATPSASAEAQHAREAARKREAEAEHRRAEAQKAKDAEAERRQQAAAAARKK